MSCLWQYWLQLELHPRTSGSCRIDLHRGWCCHALGSINAWVKQCWNASVSLPTATRRLNIWATCYVLYRNREVHVKRHSAAVLLEVETSDLILLHPVSHYSSNITPSPLPLLARRVQTLGHHSAASVQFVPSASFNPCDGSPSNFWFIMKAEPTLRRQGGDNGRGSVQTEIWLHTFTHR